ncbi:hypothetical protein B0O99DRAFT_597720 [Bisporella sp. PMI_857]|nr:hypothetical protein B0O99DRAFT_597720 [Bisporella sp. PMI_857]
MPSPLQKPMTTICCMPAIHPSTPLAYMELYFKSPTRAEIPLSLALAKDPSATILMLLEAICECTTNTSSSAHLPHESLSSHLTAIETCSSLFCDALQKVDFRGLTFGEESVVEAAFRGRYGADDHESTFYRHEGDAGIVALILFSRKVKNFKRLLRIPAALQPWFVRHVVAMLPEDATKWISKLSSIRSSAKFGTYGDLEPLYYLGNSSCRKRRKIEVEQAPFDQASIPGDPLPNLLYAFGGSIPQGMLFRGLLPQKRWDENGNIREIWMHDAGISEVIMRLFSSRTNFEQSVEANIRRGTITRTISLDEVPTLSITDQSRRHIETYYTCEEVNFQGSLFITYIYPRDQELDSSFLKTGKILFPYLRRAWQTVMRASSIAPPEHLRINVIEASLAAHRFATSSTRADLQSVLASVLANAQHLPDYLRMAVAARQSISLRFQGDHDRSDNVIWEILKSISINTTDIRSHCAYGRLLLSSSENAVLRKDFDTAESYLTRWEVTQSIPSKLEIQVLRAKNTVYGRISRYKGNFDHSKHCLEQCLPMTMEGYHHIMHHLADVYCELRIPVRAEELVLREFEKLRTAGKKSTKAFRRLGMSLSEAYIEQKKFEPAKIILPELHEIFEGILDPDIADQLGHVRSVICLARIYWYEEHWVKVRQLLENALRLAEQYPTFTDGNFYIGVINLFLAVVFSKLLGIALKSANDILQKQHHKLLQEFTGRPGSFIRTPPGRRIASQCRLDRVTWFASTSLSGRAGEL